MPYYPELGLYRPPYLRPLRVDTLDIDVTRPRRMFDVRPPPVLRRGRSVVRIRTMRRAPRPSPGARLVQKFIIPEKKPASGFERPAEPTPARRTVFTRTDCPGSIQVRDVERESGELGRDGVRKENDGATSFDEALECVSEEVDENVKEDSACPTRETETECDSEKVVLNTEDAKVSDDSEEKEICDSSVSSTNTQDVVTNQLKENTQITENEAIHFVTQEIKTKVKKIKKSDAKNNGESETKSINTSNIQVAKNDLTHTDDYCQISGTLQSDTVKQNLETPEKLTSKEDKNISKPSELNIEKSEANTEEPKGNVKVKEENSGKNKEVKLHKGIKNNDKKSTYSNGTNLMNKFDEKNESKINSNKEVTDKTNRADKVLSKNQQTAPELNETTLNTVNNTPNIIKEKDTGSKQIGSSAVSVLPEKEKVIHDNVLINDEVHIKKDIKPQKIKQEKHISTSLGSSNPDKNKAPEKKIIESNDVLLRKEGYQDEKTNPNENAKKSNQLVNTVSEKTKEVKKSVNNTSPPSSNSLDSKVQCQPSKEASANSIAPNENAKQSNQLVNTVSEKTKEVKKSVNNTSPPSSNSLDSKVQCQPSKEASANSIVPIENAKQSNQLVNTVSAKSKEVKKSVNNTSPPSSNSLDSKVQCQPSKKASANSIVPNENAKQSNQLVNTVSAKTKEVKKPEYNTSPPTSNGLDSKIQCQPSKEASVNSIVPNEKRLKSESVINKANLESEAKSSAEAANKGKPKESLQTASKDLINNGNGGVSNVSEKKLESKKTKDTVNTNQAKKVVEKKEKDSEIKDKIEADKQINNKTLGNVTVEITGCERDQSNKVQIVDKNNNSSAVLTSDEEGYGSDTEISIEEEDMETGVKKKKKVLVKKKNGKVKVTPLDVRKPTDKTQEETATAGEIKRQNSKKRLSLVDDQLGLINERKTSITDEVIAEEAAYLDSMILETMKDAGRRKSSLAFPPPLLPEIPEETEKRPEIIPEETEKRPSKIEEESEHSAPQDNRREHWHKATQGQRPGSGRTLGKFFRGHAKEESSSSSSESESEEECDVNCHMKCLSLMPNLCGVNQKLIAEALASVRRGRSRKDSPESTKTSTSTLLLNSSESSESTDSAGPQEAASRVTPPATSLPRFREYNLSDFQFLKVLGKGSFGKVLLAELSGSGCYYAVKALKKDVVLEDDDVECTMIERKVLTLGTGHPFFCHLFCTFQTESHLFFVMEYLNGGDLMFHIQESGRFDEGRARFYAAEIVSGLKFLHKWGIVYRDLKLDNVLLDFEGHARIADFGMCKLQIYLDKTTDTFCGTPDYMAPEIIKGLHYNQCVDWWSFGVLLYELMVGQSPFSGCDEDDLFWSVCNEQPQIPRYLSPSAKSILLALMEKDWTKRLGSGQYGAQDVMGHSFFEGLNWSLLERREIKPPYKPTVKNALDTKYFDKVFTQEKPRLTPVERSILDSMDQSQFEGFSYTNPNATE